MQGRDCPQGVGNCAYCNENIKGRCNHRGHRGYRAVARSRRDVEGIMQRVRRESGGEAGGKYAARDAGLEAEMPLLCGHLTERQWDDGAERETSTLLIFAGDGMFKACLNNRSEGLALWVSADSLGGTLEALERALDCSAPDWRPMRVVKGGRK